MHWAFLTATSETQKYRNLLNILIVLFFVVGPIVLLVVITVAKDISIQIHTVEIIYRIVLDLVVMVVVFLSWFKLYSRLKLYAGLHAINSIKRRLTVQMLLYIVFFFICTVFFIIMTVLSHTSRDYTVPIRFLFFFSELFGTIPLVFIMLFFLSASKPSGTSPNASVPSSFATGAHYGIPATTTTSLLYGDNRATYSSNHYANINQDADDGYEVIQDGLQVDLGNPVMYAHAAQAPGYMGGYYGMEDSM